VTRGEVNDAVRRALNIFCRWNDVTGFVPPHTSYYYELQAIIEDAVHCGAQAATGDYKKMESEQ
jgi:hypothetical protein